MTIETAGYRATKFSPGDFDLVTQTSSHPWRPGPGRPAPNAKCGACGVRQNDHHGYVLPRLLRIREVAEMLGVSYRTVWRIVQRKKLKLKYVGNRCPRIRLQDVEKLIA